MKTYQSIYTVTDASLLINDGSNNTNFYKKVIMLKVIFSLTPWKSNTMNDLQINVVFIYECSHCQAIYVGQEGYRINAR